MPIKRVVDRLFVLVRPSLLLFIRNISNTLADHMTTNTKQNKHRSDPTTQKHRPSKRHFNCGNCWLDHDPY